MVTSQLLSHFSSRAILPYIAGFLKTHFKDVYEKANKIIENFFGEDEIESAQVNNEGYYNFSASDAQAQNQANAFSF